MKSNIVSLDSLDLGNSILEGGSELLGNQEPANTTDEDESGTGTSEEEEEEGKTQDPPKTTEEQEEEEEETGNEGNEEGNQNNEEEEEEEEEQETVEALAASLGYEVPEGVTYEQNTDGIKQMFADLKPKIVEEEAKVFFEEFPLAADYVRAKQEGISDVEWAKQIAERHVDYQAAELAEDNEAMQEAVMRNHYKAKNYSTERIERNIKRLKDADELYMEAKEVFEEDKVADAERRESEKVAAETARAEAKKKNDEYLAAQRKMIVQDGKIGDLTIPTKEREAFFKARHGKLESGRTPLAEKIANMTEEQRAKLDWYIFKDGDVTKQAEKIATTKKANSLLAKSKGSNGASGMANGKRQATNTGTVPGNVLNYINSESI